MPVYEFDCKSCRTKFSKKSSIGEKDNITCPKCNSKELKQIFNADINNNSKSSTDSACNILLNKRLSGG